MARQTEPSVKQRHGECAARHAVPAVDVRSENTQTITGHAGFRPDILIMDPGRSPVVIEAEYVPGANVEAEAKSPLGAGSGGERDAASKPPSRFSIRTR